MQHIVRRVFKRIKQRHPIEVYIGGKLVLAGSGKLELSVAKPTTITFDGEYR